jgi:predicted transposase/invertase (TIGR01784 family)
MKQQSKLLNPQLDVVFKLLLGSEENRPLLLSLLNAVLDLPSPIESVQVMNPELPKAGVDDKGIALDLRLWLTSGEQVDVEIQGQGRPAGRERTLYYWSKMYAGQLVRGECVH